jgi:hypothetical protein
MFQELALQRQPAAITGEAAVSADHPVAGHDQGDGVGAIGFAHGACRRGKADALGHRAIAGGGAERDLHQRLPYLLVELRPFGRPFKLALDIGQLARIVLRFGVHARGAGGAQVEAQQASLFVHPGGEFLERGIDQAPIAFHQAASFK